MLVALSPLGVMWGGGVRKGKGSPSVYDTLSNAVSVMGQFWFFRGFTWTSSVKQASTPTNIVIHKYMHAHIAAHKYVHAQTLPKNCSIHNKLKLMVTSE